MKASERGEFAFDFRIPRVTRKVAGRFVEEELIPLGQDRELFEMDDLLEGVTQDDLVGPMSQYMVEMSKSGMRRQGSAGAGPDVGEKPERRSVNYDQHGGGEPPDQLRPYQGDDSSMNLLGQPEGQPYRRHAPRDEFADVLGPRQDGARRRHPNEYQGDDYADMSVLDPLSVPARTDRPAFGSRTGGPEDELLGDDPDPTGGSSLVRMFRGG